MTICNFLAENCLQTPKLGAENGGLEVSLFKTFAHTYDIEGLKHLLFFQHLICGDIGQCLHSIRSIGFILTTPFNILRNPTILERAYENFEYQDYYALNSLNCFLTFSAFPNIHM